MARAIVNRLETGCALDTDGTTTVWSARATTSDAPSGSSPSNGSGYILCGGVEWVDLWLTVATAAVEVTLYAWNREAATWCIDSAFGVSGVLSAQVGSYRWSHQALGADALYLRVTDVTGGGNITAQATLSQGSAR